jgi:hypothetical protein
MVGGSGFHSVTSGEEELENDADKVNDENRQDGGQYQVPRD